MLHLLGLEEVCLPPLLATRRGLPSDGLLPNGDIGGFGDPASFSDACCTATGWNSIDILLTADEAHGDHGSPMYAGVERSIVRKTGI